MAEPEVTAIDGVRDLVVEAFNARDLTLLSLAEGVDLPAQVGERLQAMMERQPRMMLTRADLDGWPVAAVWTPDAHDRYMLSGRLELVLDGDSLHLSGVPGSDERLVSESPAGFEVAEWESSTDRGWWD